MANEGGGRAAGVTMPLQEGESLDVVLHIKPKTTSHRRCTLVVRDPNHVIDDVQFDRLKRTQT
ncbi:hypothetical protein KOR42_22930 [Thalassoglobus neptunius]|uniref:Uncharacterized protein n=1 Tax=Thalassoglobus neptunius TaxID=1938619 RepID=A0A5C5X788_9PLAN|nr:hypothetical protein [Thalassoglobus neptunius]TWT58906.1 hypothetical protein KOR42_22930 [Thalassoglobus neptunius]